jgi:hypothetical protein
MYIAESNDVPCKTDPDAWFPRQEDRGPVAQWAKDECKSCLERLDCLRAVMAFEKQNGPVIGIYGGLSQVERAKLRKSRKPGRIRAA